MSPPAPFEKRFVRRIQSCVKVVHSGVEQAEHSRRGERGGIVKREPVENVHPLVRTHPVTGDKVCMTK